MSVTQPKPSEDDVIDQTIRVLYENLDKGELHFEKDVLPSLYKSFTVKEINHMWEVVLATNLVNPSIGFGKSGFMYLSNAGMQMMKMYDGYKAYLQQQKNIQLLQAIPGLTQLANLAKEMGNNQKTD